MKNKFAFFGLLVIIILLVAILVKKKGGLLPAGTLSPERKKYLADQYKAQLDGIFTQAATERRELSAAEQVEVNRLQEKLVELGYIYEVPKYSNGASHIFTPVSWAFMPFLN